MNPHSNGAGRVNSYALVTYVPDPLGSFLDRLRSSLEPDSLKPRAHVTILPPRALPEGVDPASAWDWIRGCLSEEEPFAVDIGDIEVFPGTNVIYLSVHTGFDHLRGLHKELNGHCLLCNEKFTYHPHITLAQKLTDEQAARLAAEARQAWASWTGPRSFTAHTLTFVQELSNKRWIDLQELSLRHLAFSHR